jgi:limonene-1,2-epoxide hydrolase
MAAQKSQQVVMRLFDAIMDNDRDRILSFFTDESVFQCQARDPAVGHTAIWSALATSDNQVEAVERRLCQVAERPDGRVQAERLERYLVGGVWRELKVTGVLAVSGCKITQWSDSYDAQQDQLQA